jgi:chromosome segregation ATPase
MTSSAPAARTDAAVQARRELTTAALQRVTAAVARIHKSRNTVSFASVARQAEVSRTFLYTNPLARQVVTAALTRTRSQTSTLAGEERVEALWRERALNAEDALKHANAEVLKQRSQIGLLMGKIRDMEAEWSEEAIQRVTTENTNLKQRVRQLIADNRTLDERLQAARSTLRFQDRRLADMEAQLGADLHPATAQQPSAAPVRPAAAPS